MSKKIRVLIVDDHEIMRQGLVSVFEQDEEVEIIGEAGDGEEALNKAEKLKPDIILMDIRMPKVDGITAAGLIKNKYPDIKVIMLTAIEDESDIFKAIEAGIEGYVLKYAAASEIIKVVKLVAGGAKYLDPLAAGKVMEEIKPPIGVQEKNIPNYARLTERELSVLKLMAKGFKNRDIATQLMLGEETVKTHVSHLLRKLGQPNRIQAVLFALRQGLITINDSNRPI